MKIHIKLLLLSVISVILCGCEGNTDTNVFSSQTISETTVSAAYYEAAEETTYSTEDGLPPYLKLNGKDYRFCGRTVWLDSIDLSELALLGEAAERVSGYEMPEEDFTANFAYEGAEIYTYEENTVLIPLYYIWDGYDNLVESEKPWACVCELEQ